MVARSRLAALLAVSIAGPATAQPTDLPRFPVPIPEPITAFPDIQLPKPGPMGFPDPPELFPLILGASPRAIPANAPTRRRLQIARLNELAGFLRGIDDRRAIGRWDATVVPGVRDAWLAAGQLGADIEDSLAAKLQWMEERVLALKYRERYSESRVRVGTDPPYELNVARAYRYTAEIDLLRAKELAAKEPNPPPRAKPPAPAQGVLQTFTAFPDLKVRVPAGEGYAGWLADRFRTVGTREVPFQPDNATRRKLLIARLNAGRRYLHSAWDLIDRDNFAPNEYPVLVDMTARVPLIGAELEGSPANQVWWHTERVRLLWVVENYTAGLVEVGTAPPRDLHRTRVARLAAELDLLEAQERAKGSPAPPKSAVPQPNRIVIVPFTAYTDILPPKANADGPNEFPPLPPETAKRMPRGKPFVSAFPADAPTLLKLQISRSNEAGIYWYRFSMRIRLNIQFWPELPHALDVLTLAMRSRAEVETDPVERSRWIAAWVMQAKNAEAQVARHVRFEQTPPRHQDLVEFYRLGAEAELYDLEHPRTRR